MDASTEPVHRSAPAILVVSITVSVPLTGVDLFEVPQPAVKEYEYRPGAIPDSGISHEPSGRTAVVIGGFDDGERVTVWLLPPKGRVPRILDVAAMAVPAALATTGGSTAICGSHRPARVLSADGRPDALLIERKDEYGWPASCAAGLQVSENDEPINIPTRDEPTIPGAPVSPRVEHRSSP
ncbi:hypothetical protein [Leifsonia sp. CL154]|uniref:hypothetical protein n=1 Tax=Leifsonia sp. CL154 TaxID=1798214 RepID=UPI001C318377|nr:hypothetical protein [Leifsonia sp. CL154]